MNYFLIYFAGVLLILFFSFLIVANFVRYRFREDKTYLLIFLFVVFFALNVVFTASLLGIDTVQEAEDQFIDLNL